jgi:inorganic pyrophosphatase
MRLVATVTVRVEVPRGGFVKPGADGRVDLRSPVPTPFNYGCVPGRTGGDGDPLDAVLLGPRVPAGTERTTRVHGVVRFRDAGAVDDKLVCGDHAPTRAERLALVAFFRVYAVAKRWLNRWRGRPGETAFLGLDGPP